MVAMFARGSLVVVAIALVIPTAASPRDPVPEKPVMHAPWPHPKGYVCYRVSTPITIDGKLDDDAWRNAPWTDAFVDIEGDRKPAPRHRTRAKMLWDDDALYIAAELEEPHLWAKLTDHDSVIFQDPDFEVFLDPDADNHLYAELELNARNTTWDLLLTKPYKDRGHAINSWEIIGLKTAVHLNGTLNDARDVDQGWTLEIRWPWTGLKEITVETTPKTAPVPPRDGDQWRINFSRVEWDMDIIDGAYVKVKGKPEHNWVWSPQGVIDMHRPERWGYLQFSTAASGTTPFRPDPNWEIRDHLHRVYYAQRDYHKAHGKYANTTDDLGLKGLKSTIAIESTIRRFEASAKIERPGAMSKRWMIREDALIRSE